MKVEAPPFDPSVWETFLQGRKVTTARSKRIGDPGDWFEYMGVRIRIVDVEVRELGGITQSYYRLEGVESPQKFEALWKRLHRGNYNPEKRLYLHYLARIDDFHKAGPEDV